MKVDLTVQERDVRSQEDYLRELTLAWRAFGKAVGAKVRDPIMAMDADRPNYGQIAGQDFSFQEAVGDRFLDLAYHGCWDRGAMRSLSPHCIYISFNLAADASFVTFHGWHRPKEKSRIISPKPDGGTPFLGKEGLSPMTILIRFLKQQLRDGSDDPAGPVSGLTD